MSRTGRKIIFFIVEGASDENAFHPILINVFNKKKLRFLVVHGDITQSSNENTVIKKLKRIINEECGKYGLRTKDIDKIVHITDTDGAFVDSKNVVRGKSGKIVYTENEIRTCQVESIIHRNINKSRVLKRLYETDRLVFRGVCVNYRIYYFSRNLEHVLHDEIGSLHDSVKRHLSNEFADMYEDDVPGFIDYICRSKFSVLGDYKSTWEFIAEGTNSLKRYSNFGLEFDGYKYAKK